MEIYSWFEIDREAWPKNVADETLAWLGVQEARWEVAGHLYDVEAEMMTNYAFLRMEKELFDLGARIEKFYEYNFAWYRGTFVYQYYGLYYLLVKKHTDAIYWYTKALETDMPYPYPIWRKLAVCYLELGDIENADYWLEKYIDYMAQGTDIWYVEISDHAMYYLTSGRPSKALAFLEPYLNTSEARAYSLRSIAGKACLAMGMVDRAIEYFQKQLELFKSDKDQYIELAETFYEYKKDIYQAEQNYLKALEAAGTSVYNLDFRISVNYNLAIMMANSKMWEKSYQYLFDMYKLKFPGAYFEPFESLFSSLPYIQDDTMGANIFYTLVNFEYDPILPHNRSTDERLLEDVDSLAGIAMLNGIESTGLAVVDKSQLN